MQEFEEEKTNKVCLCLSTTKARVIFCTLYLLNTIKQINEIERVVNG